MGCMEEHDKEKNRMRTTIGYKWQFSAQNGLVTNIWIIIVYLMPVCFLKAFINFVILMGVYPLVSHKIFILQIIC